MKKYIPGTKIIDLTGQEFGILKVTGFDCMDKNGFGSRWFCDCRCGTKHKSILRNALKNKKSPTKSCGCESYRADEVVGETSTNSQGNIGKIVAYRNYYDIDILIDEKELRSHIRYDAFKRGNFKSLQTPRICGIGYMGDGEYTAGNSRKHTDEYQAWKHMIERCYDPKIQEKHPTYKGVFVAEEWFNFQNFAKWYNENRISENIKYDVDKDVFGGKIYSSKTCILIPREINVALKRQPKNNNLPVGVTKVKDNNYRAQISINNKIVYKLNFTTSDDAFEWYKVQKETYLKKLADKYRDVITVHAYEAIINYTVEPFPYNEV